MRQPSMGRSTQPRQHEKYILIVEDDPANAEVLELVVTTETPYRVQLVGDAEAALHCIKQRTPDLLVLDNWLPGMKGLELYDYLQTIPACATLPALLMSVRSLSGDGLERPGLSFLAKPYEIATFLETIRALLETGSA